MVLIGGILCYLHAPMPCLDASGDQSFHGADCRSAVDDTNPA